MRELISRLAGALLLICLPLHAQAFDHSHQAWDGLLKTHTVMDDRQVLVDYKAIKADRQALDAYLKSLSAISADDYQGFSRDQQLAFLINAYNAFTVQLIIDNHPVESIKDLGSWFSSPWKKAFVPLLGQTVSLDWIEHDIIREQFPEPRIHFAVNCASIGCPSLYRDAFRADQLEAQLEAATTHFMANPDKNRFDAESGTLHLSRIFDWYGDDFERHGKGVQAFALTYLPGAKAPIDNVEFLDYDWALNETGASP